MRHANRARRTGLVFAGLLAVALSAGGQSAQAGVPAQPQGTMNAAFAAAADEYDVPRDLLVAVGYGETHLDGHRGEPSHANGYGVMHLVSNPQRRDLERASRLTGTSPAKLRTDTTANIRGGAALLSAYADTLLAAGDRDRLGAWYPVVAKYGGAKDPQVARLYADTAYELLNTGISTTVAGGEKVTMPRREVTPQRGRYAKVGPVGTGAPAADRDAPEAGEIGIQSEDYPPARWIPAHGGNYSAGRSAAIRYVIIHVTQGSYAGTISWFQNPSSGVSTHYVIRSSDGEVTQMVRDRDTAYHVRSYNSSSLGIEHEGFVS
ncbi:MAG: N-acetylmuramoyl-L-alanine amidase, partial [Micromonosporaceae bacterium]